MSCNIFQKYGTMLPINNRNREETNMTEWEKAQNGYLYDANFDEEIVKEREIWLLQRLFTAIMGLIFRSERIFIPITIVRF